MPDNKDKYEQLNQVIAELKDQPGALMPVLQRAQGIFGCVPMDVQKIIAEGLGVNPADCLYVGDTSTDMNCGTAAGMETVGVLWGYRPREELKASSARYMISSPMELLDYLDT